MWLKAALCGKKWLSVVISDFMWLKVVVCSQKWLCVVKGGFIWLKVVKSGCQSIKGVYYQNITIYI